MASPPIGVPRQHVPERSRGRELYGRKPRSARTRMMGEDLIACMLGDVDTDIDKTMIELQRQAMVHETRSAFQQVMERRFIA
jgi:uncharacterized protein YbcI